MARSESIVCTINLVVLLLAVSLIVVSILIRVDSVFILFAKYLDLGHYFVASYLSIISGFILLGLPFMACFGLVLEKHYLFMVYCAFSLVTIGLNIASCSLVWKVTDREQFRNTLSLEILQHIHGRYNNDMSYRFLETLQSELHCCGAESFRDYDQANLASCRMDLALEPKGCAESLQNYLQIRSALIGSLSIVSMILQVSTILVWYTSDTVVYKAIKS